jgi:hypothetical protein
LTTDLANNRMSAICILCAGRGPPREGRVAGMTCESPTRVAGSTSGTDREKFGLDPAPEVARRRIQPRAPPGVRRNECFAKTVAGTSCSLDRPQRGVQIGRCHDLRKVRTARRPGAFAIVSGLMGKLPRPASVFPCRNGATHRRSLAPLNNYLDLFAEYRGLLA